MKIGALNLGSLRTPGVLNLGSFAVAALFLSFTGCGTVGVLASSAHTFTMADQLTLSHPPADFFGAAADTGKSLGYDVSGISRAAGQIVLFKGANEFTTVLVGKIERIQVLLVLEKDQKTVDLKVSALGNFDTASQSAVTKIIDDFKAGITTRLGA